MSNSSIKRAENLIISTLQLRKNEKRQKVEIPELSFEVKKNVQKSQNSYLKVYESLKNNKT